MLTSMRIGFIAAFVAAVVTLPAQGAITGTATFEALNATIVSTTGPPLVDISVLRSNGGGIYTNQYNGSAATSGDLRTVAAIPINIMTDGVSYNSVFGPSTAPGAAYDLVILAALEGHFIGTGSVRFTGGGLQVVEVPTGFERRDPTTWSGGSLLAEFTLGAPENVIPGTSDTTISTPVSSSTVNLSIFDGLTIGNTDFQFLFDENSTVTTPTTGDNWMRDFVADLFPGLVSQSEGLFIEGEQDLDGNATGASLSGGFTLDAADLAVLNAVAAANGLLDLGGAGTAFATGLGAGGGGPTTDYFIDLGSFDPTPGADNSALEGDLYANTAEFNAYPVCEIPEPATALVWGGLAAISFAGVANGRRRRSA